MKTKKKIGGIIVIAFIILLGILNTSYGQVNNEENAEVVDEFREVLKVHYIDVGQGDAIFIELLNHESMLIDAGEVQEKDTVKNYISNLGYKKIDYIVGTHPHTDHIGSLAYIVDNFEVGKIYLPKAVSMSKTYENLLEVISNKGLKVTSAKAGINILNEENINIDILAPNKDSYSDLNNYSAVIKIVYNNNKFLFMGDAEVLSEKEIMEDVSSDVIKVGHHGSDSSSSLEFVRRVNAQYAIISVGEDNQYNHPDQKIIERYEKNGAKVYRTDINGNIIVISDGNIIEVKTEE